MLDGFEFNKISAAILIALLMGMVANKVSNILVSPHYLEKNSYVIEGVDQEVMANSGPKGPEPIAFLLSSADVSHGKSIAKKCLQCHNFDPGGKHKIGPALYGVVGREIAKAAGYVYSKAYKKLSGSWTFGELNKMLYKPSSYARGTKMSFAGLKNTQDRADLIAYMNTLSDAPLPLPAGKTTPEKPDESA